MDDLSMLLRNKNIFSIASVDYAILEPNGQLSVLKKAEHETVTKKDSHIQTADRLYLPTELIVDGQVVTKNLLELNLSEEWLTNQLKRNGVYAVEEVFFAELQADGSVFIDKKVDFPRH